MAAAEFECEAELLALKNLSDSFKPEKSQLVETDPFDVFLTFTVFLYLTILGLLGNILFMFVWDKVDYQLTTLNTILAHLAAADVLLIARCYINCLYFFSFGPIYLFSKSLPPSYCIISTLLSSAGYMSVFAITVASLERYIAIYLPEKHSQQITPRRTRILLMCMWIMSVGLTLLKIPANGIRQSRCILFSEESGLRPYSGKFYSCQQNTSPNGFTAVLDLIITVPALLANVYCYWHLIKRFMKKEEDTDGIDINIAISETQYTAAAKMIVICGVIFFLCKMPYVFYGTLSCLSTIGGNSTTYGKFGAHVLFQGANMLTLLNSGVKPFIYAIVNTQYSSEYLTAISFRNKVHRVRYNPSNESTASQPI
ncbi:putative somatostatin receptor type 5-like [Apostichopus japonicus]|uniref:Putative somatostatin receptor type 5-like n=1 Tax=Stichopus japonicus TaxID=307972 RepID=A0A2G8KPB9_STIJA|nr:putative somatostatin receptor type 5-like [Apostichopus japonicus]